MRECMYSVYLLAVSVSRNFRDSLGRMIHATHCVQHPDFVARTDTPVLSLVSLKRRRIAMLLSLSRRGAIRVLHGSRKPRLEVMRVDPFTRRDVGGSVADGESVLDDNTTLGDWYQRDFVPRRNRDRCLESSAARRELASGFERGHRDSDVVVGMNSHDARSRANLRGASRSLHSD